MDEPQMTINILGEDWRVYIDSSLPDDIGGLTDNTVRKLSIAPNRFKDIENKRVDFERICRHELIHAFLFESGLAFNSDWATNEEMVDWFAFQYPKISRAIECVEALTKGVELSNA